MNIENLEKEICDRLKESICNYAIIEPIPEKAANFKQPNSKAIVYVAYFNEEPDNNQSTHTVSQHTTLNFQISYSSKFLRGECGIYSLTETMLNSLIGFSIANCDPIYFSGQKFANYENEIWTHEIMISCKSMRVQIGNNSELEDDIYFSHLNINQGG